MSNWGRHPAVPQPFTGKIVYETTKVSPQTTNNDFKATKEPTQPTNKNSKATKTHSQTTKEPISPTITTNYKLKKVTHSKYLDDFLLFTINAL